jgi:hypothetical protein
MERILSLMNPILEHGSRADFKQCFMTAIPDLPKVGEFYSYGASTYKITESREDCLVLTNLLHDSKSMRSPSTMMTGIYGIYEHILKGEMIKLFDVDTKLYDISLMSMQVWPEEGGRADFKRSILKHVYNSECGICFSHDVADAEDELVMGCPRCPQVSYAIFNSPLP